MNKLRTLTFKSVSRLRKDLETQISQERANSSSANPIELLAVPASAPSNTSPTKIGPAELEHLCAILHIIQARLNLQLV